MNKDKYTIWIEAEEWAEGQCDIYNDNTDVIVHFEDGTRWAASFFTYSNLNEIIEKNKKSGECLNGKYFWSNDMILVDEVSRNRIEEVIKHLIDEDSLELTFHRCKEDCID